MNTGLIDVLFSELSQTTKTQGTQKEIDYEAALILTEAIIISVSKNKATKQEALDDILKITQDVLELHK